MAITSSLEARLPKTLSGMLSLLITGTLVATAGSIVCIGAHNLAEQGKQAGIQEMRAIAERQGMEQGQFFWRAHGATSVLARQMLMMQERHAFRDSATVMVRAVLEANPDFVGVSTGWEPGAWDAQDAAWKGRACHDTSGRFLPYWSRSSKGVTCDPLADYDKPVAGDYYLLPKQSKKDMLIDPYAYPVGGTTVLMATVVSSMVQDGKFVGITTADINLAPLQARADSFRAFEGKARITVVGNTGLVAARTGEPGAVTKPFAGMDSILTRQMLEQLRSGQKEWIREDAGVIRVAVALAIIPGDNPWAVLVEAPTDVVLSKARESTRMMIATGLVLLALLALLSQLLLRRLTSPLARISRASASLSGGDTDVELRAGGADELGRLEDDFGKLVAYFRLRCDEAREVASGNLERKVTPVSERDALGTALEAMRQELRASILSVRGVATGFAGSAKTLGDSGRHIEGVSNRTLQEVRGLETALESIGVTVDSVTEGSRILAERIREISNASQASAKASGAARMQTQASEQEVGKLEEATREVEKVVEVITAVADQTRLLALNATIEAARAGEAGKGFAVVAGEVKELASRTAQSTEEIARIVDGIRSTALSVSGSIGAVRGAIEEVDASAAGILQAVSEQHAKVREMASLAQAGGEGVIEVGRGLRQAAELAQQAANGSTDVRSQSESIRDSAGRLVEDLERFRT